MWLEKIDPMEALACHEEQLIAVTQDLQTDSIRHRPYSLSHPPKLIWWSAIPATNPAATFQMQSAAHTRVITRSPRLDGIGLLLAAS